MLICSGAPVPELLLKTYVGRGIPINQGYGLTETLGQSGHEEILRNASGKVFKRELRDTFG